MKAGEKKRASQRDVALKEVMGVLGVSSQAKAKQFLCISLPSLPEMSDSYFICCLSLAHNMIYPILLSF